MGNILVDSGEEWLIKYAFTDEALRPADMSMGLYNDATASVAETDETPTNAGALDNTEPTDGAYARQTVTLGSTADMSTAQESGDWRIDIADQTFDVTNTTGSVDSYFIVMNVALGGDTAAQDYLIWTGSLGGTFNLSNYTSFTVQDAGLKLS